MKGFRVEYFVFRVLTILNISHGKKHLKNLKLVISSEKKNKAPGQVGEALFSPPKYDENLKLCCPWFEKAPGSFFFIRIFCFYQICKHEVEIYVSAIIKRSWFSRCWVFWDCKQQIMDFLFFFFKYSVKLESTRTPCNCEAVIKLGVWN